MEITRKRGDTYGDEISLTDSETDEVINISGCSFKLSLDTRKNPTDDSTLVYTLTGVIDDPTTGVVTFAPTVEQSDLVGYYYYDIQMTDALGVIRTLVSNSYIYTQDITK